MQSCDLNTKIIETVKDLCDHINKNLAYCVDDDVFKEIAAELHHANALKMLELKLKYGGD